MIVITAPTSNIGSQVLKNIVDKGLPVRVIARDHARLPTAIRDHVETVQGSHGDIDVLNRAFVSAETVFWLVPPDPNAKSVDAAYVDFSRPACEAIKNRRVPRLVAVSALGRGIPPADNAGPVTASLKMCDLIANTGVSLRALTMPSFMDNILRQIEPVDMAAAKNAGLDNAEPRTALTTTPTTFRRWCEQVFKPAVLRWRAAGRTRRAGELPRRA